MWRDSSCLSFSGNMTHIELIISSSLLLVTAHKKCEWTSEGLLKEIEQFTKMCHNWFWVELQLWKDVNKTTCKKCHVKLHLPH